MTNSGFLSNHRDKIFILLLVITVACLYSCSINFQIMSTWDDSEYILNNKYLVFSVQNIWHIFTHPYFRMYYPVTMLSYMIDYQLTGLNSLSYHIQNVTWHALAVIAAYKIFRLFRINPWIVFIMVMIYAVHPQRVESVVWLSERKDVLCTAFYLWSIYFYISRRLVSSGFCFTAFLFFILALLSKPMAVSLPFILLSYEFYRLRTFNPAPYLKSLYGYFIPLIVFIPVAFFNQAVDPYRMQNVNHVYTVFHNYAWMIYTTILPISLNPLYPRITISSSVMYVVVFYAASAACILYLMARRRELLLYKVLPVVFCYLVSGLPVSGLVPFGTFDYADRWTYIPSLSILLAIALMISKTFPGSNNRTPMPMARSLFMLFLILYVSSLCYLNYLYQKKWVSPLELFSHSVYSADVPSTTSVEAFGMELIKTHDYKQLFTVSGIMKKLGGNQEISPIEKREFAIESTCTEGIALYFTGKPGQAYDKLKSIEYFLINNFFLKDYSILVTAILADCYYLSGQNIEAANQIAGLLSGNFSLPDYDRVLYTGYYHFYTYNFMEALIFFDYASSLRPLAVLPEINACFALKSLLNPFVTGRINIPGPAWMY